MILKRMREAKNTRPYNILRLTVHLHHFNHRYHHALALRLAAKLASYHAISL